MNEESTLDDILLSLRDFKELDIRFNRPSPRCELSNLWPRQFTFRGLECGSVEGVLSTLFAPVHMREELVARSGFDAFYAIRGEAVRNFLYFEKPIDRFSQEYTDFLYELYYAAFSQDEFSRKILVETYKLGIVLRHSVGKSGKENTILTESEFVETLNRVRKELFAEEMEQRGVFCLGA